MNIFKRIWNGFNNALGGGTKAHTNVIDLSPALTMAQAKKACDEGAKVRYCGWPKGDYVYENNWTYWKHRKTNKNIPYKWDSWGPDSMGSWEIA